jgi:hypothetical protein
MGEDTMYLEIKIERSKVSRESENEIRRLKKSGNHLKLTKSESPVNAASSVRKFS